MQKSVRIHSEHIFLSCLHFICESIVLNFFPSYIFVLFLLFVLTFLPFSSSCRLSFFLHLLLRPPSSPFFPSSSSPPSASSSSCALPFTWELFLSYLVIPGRLLFSKAHKRWLKLLLLVQGVAMWVSLQDNDTVMEDPKIAVYSIFFFPLRCPVISKRTLAFLAWGLWGRVRDKPGYQHSGTHSLKGAWGAFLRTLHYVSSLPSAVSTSPESWHPTFSRVQVGEVAWLVSFVQDVGWAAGV